MVRAKAMCRQSWGRRSKPGAHSAKGLLPWGLCSPTPVTLPWGLGTVAGARVEGTTDRAALGSSLWPQHPAGSGPTSLSSSQV